MSGTAPLDAAPATGAEVWADATLAALLFAVDPAGTGGVALRAPAGPARDRWLGTVRALLPPGAPLRRVPAGIADERLLGGLDLAATLRAGRPVAERGVLALADGGAVLLAMAERLPPGTAARVAAALDCGEVPVVRDGLSRRDPARIGVIALDEGIGDDERAPPALLDRLAFHVDLAGVSHRDAGGTTDAGDDVAAARALLPGITADEEAAEALCATALALGIASVRAPLLALRVARASAALAGRAAVSREDAALAARLVLAPRATVLPEAASPAQDPSTDGGETAADPPPDAPDAAGADGRDGSGENGPDDGEAAAEQPLGEVVLQAAQAAIPAGLLAQLRAQDAGRTREGAAGRAGSLQPGRQRGRPVGVRAGSPRDGARLSVIETLRAAAPWQRVRVSADPAEPARLRIAREDFRVSRLKRRAETTTVFVVDASGSSAAGRLAEAKGAVELLLAECYVRRDQVAVVAFRGRTAQVLLPPTRSLTRAKRSLAGLPGGGGTPLAAGIDAGVALADAVRRRGGTPSIVLLTDGRANVARDGGGRARAEPDAADAARRLRAGGFACLLVDTSPRASPAGPRLAADLGARYLALPYAGAAALSAAIRATSRPT